MFRGDLTGNVCAIVAAAASTTNVTQPWCTFARPRSAGLIPSAARAASWSDCEASGESELPESAPVLSAHATSAHAASLQAASLQATEPQAAEAHATSAQAALDQATLDHAASDH